jgi:predicted nucleotidyltransferase
VPSKDSPAGLADLAAAAPGLRLLLLFGSRARGDQRATSDWDLGYVGTGVFDPDGFLAELVDLLGTDRIDLADLTRAGAQLRFRAARDGCPMFEVAAGEFARFWFDAVSFWCDVQPILRAGYDHVLAELGP